MLFGGLYTQPMQGVNCPSVMTYKDGHDQGDVDYTLNHSTIKEDRGAGGLTYGIIVDLDEDETSCNSEAYNTYKEAAQSNAEELMVGLTNDGRGYATGETGDGTKAHPTNPNKVCCTGVKIGFAFDKKVRVFSHLFKDDASEDNIHMHGDCSYMHKTEEGRTYHNTSESKPKCYASSVTIKAEARQQLKDNNIEYFYTSKKDEAGQGKYRCPTGDHCSSDSEYNSHRNTDGSDGDASFDDDSTNPSKDDKLSCYRATYSYCRSASLFDCETSYTTVKNSDFESYKSETETYTTHTNPTKDRATSTKILLDPVINATTISRETSEEDNVYVRVASSPSDAGRNDQGATGEGYGEGTCCNHYGFGEVRLAYAHDCKDYYQNTTSGCGGNEQCDIEMHHVNITDTKFEVLTQLSACDEKDTASQGALIHTIDLNTVNEEITIGIAPTPNGKITSPSEVHVEKITGSSGRGQGGAQPPQNLPVGGIGGGGVGLTPPDPVGGIGGAAAGLPIAAPANISPVQNPDPAVPLSPTGAIANIAAAAIPDGGDCSPNVFGYQSERPNENSLNLGFQKSSTGVGQKVGSSQYNYGTTLKYSAFGNEFDPKEDFDGDMVFTYETTNVEYWTTTHCMIEEVHLPYHAVETTQMIVHDITYDFSLYPFKNTHSIKYYRTNSTYEDESYSYETLESNIDGVDYTCNIAVLVTYEATHYFWQVTDDTRSATFYKIPHFNGDISFWVPMQTTTGIDTTSLATQDIPTYLNDSEYTTNPLNKVYDEGTYTEYGYWQTSVKIGPKIDGHGWDIVVPSTVSTTYRVGHGGVSLGESSASSSRSNYANGMNTVSFIVGRGPCPVDPTVISYCEKTVATIQGVTSKTGWRCNRDFFGNCDDTWDTWTYEASGTVASVVASGYEVTSVKEKVNTCDCCAVVRWEIQEANASFSESGRTLVKYDLATTTAPTVVQGQVFTHVPILISASKGGIGYKEQVHNSSSFRAPHPTYQYNGSEAHDLTDYQQAKPKFNIGQHNAYHESEVVGYGAELTTFCSGRKETVMTESYNCEPLWAKQATIYLEDVIAQLGTDYTDSIIGSDLAILQGGNPNDNRCSDENTWAEDTNSFQHFWYWKDACGDQYMGGQPSAVGSKFKKGMGGFFNGGGGGGMGGGAGNCGPYFDDMAPLYMFGIFEGMVKTDVIDEIGTYEQGYGYENEFVTSPLIGNVAGDIRPLRNCWGGDQEAKYIVPTLDSYTFFVGGDGSVNLNGDATTTRKATYKNSRDIPIALLYNAENRDLQKAYYGGTSCTIYRDNSQWLVSSKYRKVDSISYREEDSFGVPKYTSGGGTGTQALRQSAQYGHIKMIQPEYEVFTDVRSKSHPDKCASRSITYNVGAGLAVGIAEDCTFDTSLNNCCPPLCDSSSVGKWISKKFETADRVLSNTGRDITYKGGGSELSYWLYFPSVKEEYENIVNCTLYGTGTQRTVRALTGQAGEFIEIPKCQAFALCTPTVYEACFRSVDDDQEFFHKVLYDKYAAFGKKGVRRVDLSVSAMPKGKLIKVN